MNIAHIKKDIKVKERPAIEDSRSRVGRERRERMVERLLAATMQVCAEKGHVPIVIDDVISAADVSRGTFYKYFTSLDDAIQLVGARLADEINLEGAKMVKEIQRPIERTAIGLRMIFARAAIDQNWGAFVCRTSYTENKTFTEQFASSEFMAGRTAGDYRFDHMSSVLDLTLGAIGAGVRRIISTTVSRTYITDLSIHILMGLGARSRDAAQAAEAAAVFFALNAPDRLPWWPQKDAAACVQALE